MRKILPLTLPVILVFLMANTAISQVKKTLSPHFTLGWGYTANNTKSFVVEGGAWGNESRFSFYVGIKGCSQNETPQLNKEVETTPAPKPFINPYGRVGFRTFENKKKTFLQQATVVISTEPELTYRLYQKLGSWSMIAIEPRFIFGETKTVGGTILFTCKF